MGRLKALLFVVAFLLLLAAIDLSIYFLFGQTVKLLFKLFHLKWYWLALLTGFTIAFIFGTWTAISMALARLTMWLCKISFQPFCLIAVSILAFANAIYLNYTVWSVDRDYNFTIVAALLLFTYLSLQVCYGLYYGAKLNFKENHIPLTAE